MKRLFKVLPLILLMASCSTMNSVTNKAEGVQSQSQSEAGNQENFSAEDAIKVKKMLERHFQTVADAAKAEGPEAVKYLSTDLLLKANDASLRGDSLSASILFKIIVDLNPQDLYLRKRLAVELVKSNQIDESLEHLKYLISKGDSDLKNKAKLLLAGVYSALKMTEESTKIYEDIVSSTGGEYPDACAFLAKSYMANDKKSKAMGILDFCISKTPKNKSMFQYYKGRFFFDDEKLSEAVAILDKSITADPENVQSVILLGYIHETKGAKKKALNVYERYLKENPMGYSVLVKYVDLLFTEGKYEKVIPHLEKLISIDSENLNYKVRLGVLYTELGKIDEAKDIFSEILNVMPDSDKVLYYLASLYQHTAESEKAIDYFSRIKDDSALFHDSNVQIAQILNNYALIEKAGEKKLVEFISKNEKKSDGLNVELNVILAGYFEAKNNYSAAIQTLEKVQTSKSFNDGHEYYLAALYEKNEKFFEANKLISKMLEKNPNNAHALNFLGYSILERGGDMNKAYEYISRAVKLRPEDGYIRDSLSWYYYKKGDFKQAYEESKRAIDLVGNDVVITKHLALIYRAMNNYDKAKEYYVEALKLCKQSSEREEVIKELEDLEMVRLPASK